MVSYEPGMFQTVQRMCETNVKLSENYLKMLDVGFDIFPFTCLFPKETEDREG